MNQVIENILNRRSTRVYTEEKVDVEILKEIVKAGLHAPSSKNKQLWHFTVIQNENILKQLDEDTKNAIKKYAPEEISDEKTLKTLISRANKNLFKFDKEKGKEYSEKFQIPENYIPTHAIIIGHKKNESSKASARRENTVTYILD